MISSFRESVLWKALYVFRGNISQENADVFLYLLFIHKLVWVDNNDDPHELLDRIKVKSNEYTSFSGEGKSTNTRNIMLDLFNIYDRDLQAIGVQNVKYIFTLISMYEQSATYNLAKVFEESLEEINSYKKFDVSTTPNYILDLMSSVANLSQANTVYNPFAGQASFGIHLTDQNYVGQEHNLRTWTVGVMRLLVHGKKVNNYTNTDSVHDNLFAQHSFDVVLSCPPFGLKLDQNALYYNQTKTAEEFALLRGYECLKPNGTLAVLVSNGKLTGSILNKYFIDQKAIAAVIHLPVGILANTGIATSIVVLKKAEQQKVLFIDASEEFQKGKKNNYLTQAHIDKIIACYENKESIPDYSIVVSNTEIAENEYFLSFSRYGFNAESLIEISNIDPNQNLVKLSDLLVNLPLEKAVIGQKGKTIRIKNLADDVFNPNINIDLLQEEILEKPWQKITSKAILLSKRFNNLKPSIIEAEESNPVFISPDIFAFHLKEDIDYNFLIWQLSSDFVQKQLEAFTTGAVMPSITLKNLLQIVIPIPTLFEQQKSLFLVAKHQADKDKIVRANLQGTIDALIKDRFEEFQWDLHDIRNSELLAITQQTQILSKIIQRISDAAQTIVDPSKNINLQDYMEKLLVNTQALAKKISTIYEFATTQEQFEVFDVVSFVENFMKTQEHFDLEQINYELITDNIQEIYVLGLSIQVKFNKADLTRIMNNIVENVKRHASFDLENPSLNKFSIVIELPTTSQVKISFLNSGEKTEVTPSMYFSRDRKWGKTGNSGMGGYAIKKLSNRNSAQVDVETFTEGEYVFGVSLLINRVTEYVI
jgi:type I restriction enzyme M protein